MKQVQGDKIVPSFRIYFGIARLKSINPALATLKRVQGDKKQSVMLNLFQHLTGMKSIF
ncbi:TPA: hypothetical protein IAD52_08385 [Candidatus Spyradomonas excrementavium]|nr:hypothetical protein [Candidatus Spyradomonas excrementavium]